MFKHKTWKQPQQSTQKNITVRTCEAPMLDPVVPPTPPALQPRRPPPAGVTGARLLTRNRALFLSFLWRFG